MKLKSLFMNTIKRNKLTNEGKRVAMDKIRWGLMGAGAIIDRWILGAMQHDDMEIVCCGSRTIESAKKMAKKYKISNACTYDELLMRDDIDVVYVAVPHTSHKELTIKALKAGKHVLCEKPAGINANEWYEMVDTAKECGKFLMEASWTKFFPIIPVIKSYIGEEGIGDVRVVSSDFAFRNTDTSSRLLDPNRAGGGLLDVGVYNLNFQRIIYEKEPTVITGVASIATDELKLNIDEQAAYIAQYDDGALGIMASAVRTSMIDTAYIYGTKGHMIIPHFWKPSSMELVIDGTSKEIECPVDQKIPGIEDEGYQYEIAHVNECIRNGLIESPVMKWSDTEAILKQCDELRKQWGLKYPME